MCTRVIFLKSQFSKTLLVFISIGHETIKLEAGNEITLRTSKEWEDAGSTDVSQFHEC
jgi:hypothetical protein